MVGQPVFDLATPAPIGQPAMYEAPVTDRGLVNAKAKGQPDEIDPYRAFGRPVNFEAPKDKRNAV